MMIDDQGSACLSRNFGEIGDFVDWSAIVFLAAMDHDDNNIGLLFCFDDRGTQGSICAKRRTAFPE